MMGPSNGDDKISGISNWIDKNILSIPLEGQEGVQVSAKVCVFKRSIENVQ